MFLSIVSLNHFKTPTHISVNTNLPSERKTLVKWKFHVINVVFCWPLAYWILACMVNAWMWNMGRKEERKYYMFGIIDNFKSHLAIHTIQ